MYNGNWGYASPRSAGTSQICAYGTNMAFGDLRMCMCNY
jgi:hypothetical protein